MTRKYVFVLFLLCFILVSCSVDDPNTISLKEIKAVEKSIHSFENYKLTYDDCYNSLAPYFSDMSISSTIDNLPLLPTNLGIYGIGFNNKIFTSLDIKDLNIDELDKYYNENVKDIIKDLYGDISKPISFSISDSYDTSAGRYYYTSAKYEIKNILDPNSNKNIKLTFYRKYLVSNYDEQEKIISIESNLQIDNRFEIDPNYESYKENYEMITKNVLDNFFENTSIIFTDTIPY